MAKNRISRKELLKKPDEFITFSAKMFKFIDKYKNEILYTVSGIILLVVIISGISYFNNKAENKSFLILGKAIVKYNSDLKKLGPEKAFLGVESDLRQVLEKYPGKEGGKKTRIFFASICYDSGKYDEAIRLYKESLEDNSGNKYIKNQILNGLAYSFEAKNNIQSAVEHFEMIAADKEAVSRDDALFNLGRLYNALGNKVKSRDSYGKILSDYPDSIYLKLAKEKISG